MKHTKLFTERKKFIGKLGLRKKQCVSDTHMKKKDYKLGSRFFNLFFYHEYTSFQLEIRGKKL